MLLYAGVGAVPFRLAGRGEIDGLAESGRV